MKVTPRAREVRDSVIRLRRVGSPCRGHARACPAHTRHRRPGEGTRPLPGFETVSVMSGAEQFTVCGRVRRDRRIPSRRSLRGTRRGALKRHSRPPGSWKSRRPGARSPSWRGPWPGPPSRWRSPSRLGTYPLPIHGVVTGPSLMRPSAPSNQYVGSGPRTPAPVQPDPALRVLGAPVVPDHAAPALQLDLTVAPRRAPCPGEAGVGIRAQELGLRDGPPSTSNPSAGERAPLPGRRRRKRDPSRRRAARSPRCRRRVPGLEAGVADHDVGAVAGRIGPRPRVTFEATGPSAAPSKSVNQTDPCGSWAGVLVHRVPDPDSKRLLTGGRP